MLSPVLKFRILRPPVHDDPLLSTRMREALVDPAPKSMAPPPAPMVSVPAVSLKVARFKMPPVESRRFDAFAILSLVPNWRIPPVIDVDPVYELLPVNNNVPLPAFTTPEVPVPSILFEISLRVVEVVPVPVSVSVWLF